jgi:translation initiation factor IF-2
MSIEHVSSTEIPLHAVLCMIHFALVGTGVAVCSCTFHKLKWAMSMQADASGTVEAVKAALGALPQDSVLLRFLVAVPNNITTSDIDLAAASEALVVGFNAEPSEEVAAAAKERGAQSISSGV